MKKQDILNHLKPLEWRSEETVCMAVSGNLVYIAEEIAPGRIEMALNGKVFGVSEKQDLAKIHCQNHYKQTILNCFNT